VGRIRDARGAAAEIRDPRSDGHQRINSHYRATGRPAKREDDPQEDPLARQAQRRQAVRSAKTDWCEAAGRQWQATLYEDRWTDEEIQYVRRTWVSPRVPYHGILRMELYGDGQLEARLMLIDYGPR